MKEIRRGCPAEGQEGDIDLKWKHGGKGDSISGRVPQCLVPRWEQLGEREELEASQ